MIALPASLRWHRRVPSRGLARRYELHARHDLPALLAAPISMSMASLTSSMTIAPRRSEPPQPRRPVRGPECAGDRLLALPLNPDEPCDAPGQRLDKPRAGRPGGVEGCRSGRTGGLENRGINPNFATIAFHRNQGLLRNFPDSVGSSRVLGHHLVPLHPSPSHSVPPGWVANRWQKGGNFGVPT